ncbi:MAG: hypothetical protein IEMM0008_0585 [bacterium]|nr:MAG: hypothetical protein IEMM0008_0585 [bacterium]
MLNPKRINFKIKNNRGVKSMKKLILLVLMAFAIGIFAQCGDDNSKASTAATDAAVDKAPMKDKNKAKSKKTATYMKKYKKYNKKYKKYKKRGNKKKAKKYKKLRDKYAKKAGIGAGSMLKK